jgi:hypothetical protein
MFGTEQFCFMPHPNLKINQLLEKISSKIFLYQVKRLVSHLVILKFYLVF